MQRLTYFLNLPIQITCQNNNNYLVSFHLYHFFASLNRRKLASTEVFLSDFCCETTASWEVSRSCCLAGHNHGLDWDSIKKWSNIVQLLAGQGTERNLSEKNTIGENGNNCKTRWALNAKSYFVSSLLSTVESLDLIPQTISENQNQEPINGRW